MKNTISLVRVIRIKRAEKAVKRILLAAFALLSVLFLFTMITKGAKNRRNALEIEERENCESEFIARSREYLNNKGYGFAGVNLTKSTNDEGEYEYSLLLCHERFGTMNDDAEFILKRDLEGIKKECSLGRMEIDFR